jgi:dienelactone hydrolase
MRRITTRSEGSWWVLVLVSVLIGLAAAPIASATPPRTPDVTPGVCDKYAGDPAFGTAEWTARDLNNVSCSYQRHVDSHDSPAFLAKKAQQDALEAVQFASVTAPAWAAEPTRTHANCCTSPSSKVGDPFRTPEEWAAQGRGRHLAFSFINKNGAKLAARLYAPKAPGKYPAITFTPGLQSYNEVNSWFAQGFAEAGYVVLIVDPQAQGDSENCGHAPDGTTTTCPQTDQPDDTRSAIDFVLSTPSARYPWAKGVNAAGTPDFNPWWASVDGRHLGIAGHSLGAIAATPIGQEDKRVSAIVSYDNLDASLPDKGPRRTPTLFFGTDYAFPATGTPKTAQPDSAQHLVGAFNQLKAASVDAMTVTTRASDHYDFGFQPFPADLPSSRLGERIDLYYSLAWFGRYLRNDSSSVRRLAATTFDASADVSSIGAGTYDAAKAAANPTDPFAGNVPYRIQGRCVADLLSFYFTSRLTVRGLDVPNLRARGCPAAVARPASKPETAGGAAKPTVSGQSSLPTTGGTSALVLLGLTLVGAGVVVRRLARAHRG